MAKTRELEAAYRATTYRVFRPGGSCDLRDRASLRCAGRVDGREDVDCFAIVTAHNPGSQPTDAARNAERQSQLECDLLEGNYEPYLAQNLPTRATGQWKSCFVADLLAEDACALAGDYGQNTVICGGADGVPHLVWVEDSE